MDKLSEFNIDISSRGKTIKTLIQELKSFENQDAEVKISFDCGKSSKNVGLVGRINGCCILMKCKD